MSRQQQKEAPDLMPTKGYNHMLKYLAMDFSTIFAELNLKISSFTDSVITAKS